MTKKTTKKVEKDEKLLDELEKSMTKRMRKMENDPDCTVTDMMKIYDRVLKLEALKKKKDDFGAGFFDNDGIEGADDE